MTTTLTPSATVMAPPAATSARDGGDPALTDHERAKRIRGAVRQRSKELRQAHPILRHQTGIGAATLAASTVVVVGMAAAYTTGAVPWWVTLIVSALAMSIAHEIEHDQIHRLYFARNPRGQHLMFAVCWMLRPYTISPWVRRSLHLLHHEASGTDRDIEERGITNGVAWSPKRLLMMIDPLASVLLSSPADPGVRRLLLRGAVRSYFPLTYLALGVWYGFLGLGVADLLTGGAATAGGVAATAWAVLKVLTVVWIGPNVLRVACLHFISSNVHYFGDVEDGNVVEQTQVLNRWWLAPLQLFCFNFGSTHGIHHFVPSDPFYLRQMTAPVAHRAMRANGVRFNDLGTFRRANRFDPIEA